MPKRPRSWTNEYVRHGTQTLIAALEIATGKVVAHIRNRRTSVNFLRFMNDVVRAYPDRELHVVADNLNIHENEARPRWLGRHHRVQFHYTPTHASWVNLIECFFSILSKQGLAHSVQRSKQELKDLLGRFLAIYNANCGPFTWTKGPEQLAAHHRNNQGLPSSASPKAAPPERQAEETRFYKELMGRCTRFLRPTARSRCFAARWRPPARDRGSLALSMIRQTDAAVHSRVKLQMKREALAKHNRPLRPGLPERQTHDYERHGTTTLFAALDVAAGKIIGQCQPRHRHQEFLRFLAKIDAATAAGMPVHLILDNDGTHKHPDVKAWFAEHPRYQVHFTPTSASWLNQVERWFAEITRKRIRRGTFRSVREHEKPIRDYIRAHNKAPQPFQWVASANKIVAKVRKYKQTSETGD